jgi:hypothetical protein
MRRLLRWYGGSPLHLLALLACFALAGYAAAHLVSSSRPLGVAIWFFGAVVGHDLLLVPLYTIADRSVMAVIRHRRPQLPAVPSINYIRVPAALSGLLLLVWFPLILRLPSGYHASTTLSQAPYVWHWLAVTGALFLLSAIAFAFRLRGKTRKSPPPERPPVTPGGTAPDPGKMQPGTPPEPPVAVSGDASPDREIEDAAAGGHDEHDSSAGQRDARTPRDGPAEILDQAGEHRHEPQPEDENPPIQPGSPAAR